MLLLIVKKLVLGIMFISQIIMFFLVMKLVLVLMLVFIQEIHLLEKGNLLLEIVQE